MISFDNFDETMFDVVFGDNADEPDDFDTSDEVRDND